MPRSRLIGALLQGNQYIAVGVLSMDILNFIIYQGVYQMENQEIIFYLKDGGRKVFRPAVAFQMDYNLKVGAVTYIELATGTYKTERIELENVAHIKLN